VLYTYCPPGQTSWSKGLVRHGADPRLALAGVLGAAAEDIQVRGRGQQAPSPSLNPTRQYKNADDDEKKAGAAARVVAPTAAIRPGRQRTKQDDDQDDEQDCAEHGDTHAVAACSLRGRYGPIWLSVTLPVASMTIVIGLSPFIAFAVAPPGLETMSFT